MDLHGIKFLMFIYGTLFVGAMPSHNHWKYNGHTLIMPIMTEDNMSSPLTLNSSIAENWCSMINASLPRITDETDEKNMVDFIRNATQKYQFRRIQVFFLKNINHTVGEWKWVNGQTHQGFTTNSSGKDDYFFGYLCTDDYLIHQSPSEARRCICETSNPSNIYSRCDMKLNNKCYWKKDAESTWYNARGACVHEGGDLVSYDSVNETALKGMLRNLSLNASNGYWVGLSKSVWRWNANNEDSEIRYHNWKPDHPPDYNATCLCLGNSSSYAWIACDCDKQYPFICKRSETSTQNLPMDQMANTSVTSETVTLASVLSSCALIVIIILVCVAFFIRKQRNSLSIRPVNSCSYDDTSAPRTTTINVIPIYGEIEEARGTQSTANWSASKTTYAIIQPAEDTSLSEANTTEYVSLDLPQRKK